MACMRLAPLRRLPTDPPAPPAGPPGSEAREFEGEAEREEDRDGAASVFLSRPPEGEAETEAEPILEGDPAAALAAIRASSLDLSEAAQSPKALLIEGLVDGESFCEPARDAVMDPKPGPRLGLKGCG